MAKQFREATPPGKYTGSSTMRGCVLVDPDMQKLRVREHCYQPDPEFWSESAKQTTPRCPAEGKEECEIYQDQLALKMRTEVLPCCGALIPNQVITVGENSTVFDEIEANESLRTILNSQEIFIKEGEA